MAASSLEPIPSEADWALTGRDEELWFEVEYARKMFAGLSHAQAVALFFEGSILERAEDLNVMPPVPFRFYLRAFLEYLLSDRLRTDPGLKFQRASAASAFLGYTTSRLERWPGDLAQILDEILGAVDFVAAHQSDFDARESIFGSFPQQAATIHDRAAARIGEHKS